MTTKDEALKLALEAMEGACGSYNVPLTAQVCEAIEACRAALAEQDSEPVAFMFEFPDKRVAPKFDSAPHGGNWKPLYTTPQPAPAVQPLTDEQIASIVDNCESNVKSEFLIEFARAIEAAHGIKKTK